MVESWRVTEPRLLCFDGSRMASFKKRRVASWVMEPVGCLPQNKSLSREKSCLAKIPVCHGMKEVAML